MLDLRLRSQGQGWGEAWRDRPSISSAPLDVLATRAQQKAWLPGGLSPLSCRGLRTSLVARPLHHFPAAESGRGDSFEAGLTPSVRASNGDNRGRLEAARGRATMRSLETPELLLVRP